jgi:hypothetical protein
MPKKERIPGWLILDEDDKILQIEFDEKFAERVEQLRKDAAIDEKDVYVMVRIALRR